MNDVYTSHYNILIVEVKLITLIIIIVVIDYNEIVILFVCRFRDFEYTVL